MGENICEIRNLSKRYGDFALECVSFDIPRGAIVAVSYTHLVYISPSTSSMSVTVPANMQVNFTAMNGGWAQVKNGSVTGYVPLQYITLMSGMKGYITKETKIYQSASKSSLSAGPLPVNTVVYVVGVENGFWRVKNSDGSVLGYVPGDCASPNPVEQRDVYKRQGNAVDRAVDGRAGEHVLGGIADDGVQILDDVLVVIDDVRDVVERALSLIHI